MEGPAPSPFGVGEFPSRIGHSQYPDGLKIKTVSESAGSGLDALETPGG